MNLTYTSAAKHAKCSPTLIKRMVAAGELTKGPKRGRSHTITVANPEALLKQVKENHPKSGWHKRTAPKAAKAQTKSTTKGKSNLFTAIDFYAAIPADKRPILLLLAKRFSAVELRLILEVD